MSQLHKKIMIICAHLIIHICYYWYNLKTKQPPPGHRWRKQVYMMAIIVSRKNLFDSYVIEKVQSITYVERDLLITYLDEHMEVHIIKFEALDTIVSIA